MDTNTLRPYLVIPKLIEQPTWGGAYIAETKKWQQKPELSGKKIGQSYELYDKSNLSLLTDSTDPAFAGELADSKSVEVPSSVPNTISLTSLISSSPEDVLGKNVVSTYGTAMHLLLKFTQALGNSFQLHVPDGLTGTKWKAKPESWYYFEPGLITCGVKKGVNWEDYQKAVTDLDTAIQTVASRVRDGSLAYPDAQAKIAALIKQYDPWQYVNLVRIEKKTLLDLSPCGIHHSWEEDLATIPLGNVLYEIQLNVMDDVSTLRSFDKGKMSKDGSLRPLTIDDYFKYADRSPEANDPTTHMRKAVVITGNDQYCHERLLQSKYYTMDKVKFKVATATFSETIDSFRHVFVKSGDITVSAGTTTVRITAGHSAFIPASVREYLLQAAQDKSDVLISY